MSEKTLRIELRTKNNILWQAIHAQHPTVAAFCRAHGLRQTDVGPLLTLRESPWTLKGQPTFAAARCSEATGIAASQLFPFALYEGHFGKPVVLEADPTRFRPLAEARRLALPPVQEDAVIVNEQRERLAAALSTITEREQLAVEAYFGMGAYREPRSFAQVGALLKVGPERARQILARALRRLRHPARSSKLRGLLDGHGLKQRCESCERGRHGGAAGRVQVRWGEEPMLCGCECHSWSNTRDDVAEEIGQL